MCCCSCRSGCSGCTGACECLLHTLLHKQLLQVQQATAEEQTSQASGLCLHCCNGRAFACRALAAALCLHAPNPLHTLAYVPAALRLPHLAAGVWCVRHFVPCRAHPQEQQGAIAPAAAAKQTSSSSQQQQAPPSPSQVAELLYSRWLVDVPKMMDLAVLYAPGSTQLVQQLLHQLLMLQPKYAQVSRDAAGRSTSLG